jgi:hypothetical protein
MRLMRCGALSAREENSLVFNSSIYDAHLACGLFAAWKQCGKCEKRAMLQELLLQLAPLVDIVAASELNPNLGDGTIDVLKSEALEHVFFTLAQEYIPSRIAENPRTFTGYFWTMIRIGLIRSLHRTCDPQVFDFYLVCSDPPCGRLCKHEDVETRVHIRQFYDLVLHTAINDIRFEGKERRACIYIGKCLVGVFDLHPLSARFRYKLPKSKVVFLIQYMEHLLRRTAYELRQLDVSEDTRAANTA